jgi:hypothetical protein
MTRVTQMAERNWAAITSGATFEALVKTLVSFQDPMAALFGRLGQDGGQDARSGDGTRVFQAKYHEDRRVSRAIADAKGEAKKIRVYRDDHHERNAQWKGVTHWRLVTNASFNPKDRQIWDDEVVPLFAAQGLSADYWERADLDALLDRYPEVHRSFFENETRAFLSIPEVRDRLPLEEPFLQRPELGGFFGRADEIGHVRAFLESPELFLVVHGAGGIGKTRLLLEAGAAIASDGVWQVLWANVASMSATGAWFDGITPERQTLLLVDEPPDEGILQQLFEQLGGRAGRAARWKVAVAIRSPKDPVLRFLFGPRIKPRVRELEVARLTEDAARAMCADLFASGSLASLPHKWKEDAAAELARRFDRHPVWLTLSVHLLESRGDLATVPATARDLADSYFEEIVGGQAQGRHDELLGLLRWVALLRTVNRADDATMEFIGTSVGGHHAVELRRMIAGLVARRALFERGANNRFVEMKPDVLRDRVLLSWLTEHVDFGNHPIVPSPSAKALVATVRDRVLTGEVRAVENAILASLGRAELLLRFSGHDVGLLDDFFSGIGPAIPAMPASRRIVLAELLTTVAQLRPLDTVHAVAAMRSSTASDETITGIFRERTVRHGDVILHLAWPLFHAAMGAQTTEAQQAVLNEFCALAEAEGNISEQGNHRLPNDGRRTAQLVERTLEGGPEFWGDFDAAARAQGQLFLNDLSRTAPTPGKRALLKALVQPAIAVERRQTWSDERAIHFRTYAVAPDDSAWVTRTILLGRIKELLQADTTPLESRMALWPVLVEAHRSINMVCTRGPEPLQQQYAAALLEDLTWARTVLASRIDNLEELSAARDLWDWHRQFEEEPHLKAASEQLEALYASNALAMEFEPLLGHDKWEEQGSRALAKAADLAAEGEPGAIAAFVDRAVRFMGDGALNQLYQVALALGAHAVANPVVQAFITNSLLEPKVTAQTDFATVAAMSWVTSLRTSNASMAPGTVTELMRRCGSDEQRAHLVLRIYRRIPLKAGGEVTPAELDLFRSLGPFLVANGQGPAFIEAAVSTLHYDWSSVRDVLEQALATVPQPQLRAALRALIEGTYWAVREATSPAGVRELGTWLLDQLVRLDDFGALGGNIDWHLREVFKRVTPAPVTWLPGALNTRSAREQQEGRDVFRAVSHEGRLSKYVQRINASDVESPLTVGAISALVGFAAERSTVGYFLPKVLRDVDPNGFLVPREVARRLTGLADIGEIRPLARIGGAYTLGGEAWRAIAKPALAAVTSAGAENARTIYSALVNDGFRSWSGTPGEVPPMFVSAVGDAKHALASETDTTFRGFWEWRLACAEAELRDEIEQAKEERGE